MNDQAAQGLIKELQFVCLVILDLDGTGRIIQKIAGLGLYLMHNIATGFQIRDGDIAALIGAVLTVGTADNSTVGGRHLENGVSQRRFRDSIHLFDDKPTQWDICKDNFFTASAGNFDGMCGVIQQISGLCFQFGDGITAAGNAVQADVAVCIGGISSCRVLAAVAAGDTETNTTQRLSCHTV